LIQGHGLRTQLQTVPETKRGTGHAQKKGQPEGRGDVGQSGKGVHHSDRAQKGDRAEQSRSLPGHGGA